MGWGTTISKYPEKEVEPARRPLRKPALLHKARGAPSVPGPYCLLSHWSLSSYFPAESSDWVSAPAPGYKYNPLHTPLSLPPPTWPRPGLSIRASCLCLSSEHPHSGRRGPLASRGRTPFPPPLLAQEGVLSHVGGCRWEGGIEEDEVRYQVTPNTNRRQARVRSVPATHSGGMGGGGSGADLLPPKESTGCRNS